MNKKELILEIIGHLTTELDLTMRAAKAAHAEATHEQSKAENKYDTRGLEASYLARGQSKQASETEKTIQEFRKLDARAFGSGDPIDLGAVVELSHGQEKSLYFLAPRGGGIEVQHAGRDVLVVTPQSPLGAKLIGKKTGQKIRVEIDRSSNDYNVISVC